QNGRSNWRAWIATSPSDPRSPGPPLAPSHSNSPPPVLFRMLRLGRVTLREIHLALKEPFRISSGVMSARRILLLGLAAEGGAAGWSECAAFRLPIYSPETIDTAWLAVREWLAPRIVGRELPHPSAVHAILERDIRGHNMAKAALEMGCWALAAE